MTGPAPAISPELRALLRRVKLGKTLDTLPERLALARSRSLGHTEFLELVLSDEVTRRDTHSAALRARTAGLDPAMRLENWDDTAAVTYDRATLDELVSGRYLGAGHNVLILGPVGVGKTFLATALGHAAIRQRASVHFERADRLFKRLKASRLDNSHDAEIRKLIRVDLLIIDDLCLPSPRPRRHCRHLRTCGRASPPGGHHRDLESGAHRVASPHGRRTPGPVRHRPAPVIRLRTRPRRRQLPPTTKTGPYPATERAAPATPTPAHLTNPPPYRHHRHVDARGARTRSHATGGEMVPSRWRATIDHHPEEGPAAVAREDCFQDALRPKRSARVHTEALGSPSYPCGSVSR